MTRAVEEHDYIGLSGVSSIKKPSEMPMPMPKSKPTKISKSNFFKATELRLGLPGLEFPENGVNFSLGVVKNRVSGTKRGFSDAMEGGSRTWVFPNKGGSQMGSLKNAVSFSPAALGDDMNLQSSFGSVQDPLAEASSKVLVVGWPPVRSCRKNSVAIPKTEEDCKPETGCLYIKVSMIGAPYLRKVDLKTYGSYSELSVALGKMFSGFTIGQLGSQGPSGQGSEYVITYDDKDNDWMLVGDVPWNMFMDSCRRLRIIKSSEAVGLVSDTGSRATEKLLP